MKLQELIYLFVFVGNFTLGLNKVNRNMAIVLCFLKIVLAFLILPTNAIEVYSKNLTNNSNITMFEEEVLAYEFDCALHELVPLTIQLQQVINVSTENDKVASFFGFNNSQLYNSTSYQCHNGTAVIHVKSGHLGITQFQISIQSEDMKSDYSVLEYTVIDVKVLRKITLFDKLAVFVLTPLVLINKCAFGAKIELGILKQILTKPVELVLCFTVQFIVMPLIGVFLGYVCNLTKVMALALLVSSSCPGGGGGYVFSFLINGDITLAITASLMSTLIAIGAMPAVIGTYVAAFGIPNQVNIPYLDIIIILVAIAVPISIGMFIRKKWPNFASKLIMVIRPLSWIIIAGGLIMFIVTSRYVMYGPKIGILVAVLLPFSTFLISIVLARCLSFQWPMAKAVSLESGLKNTVLGIAVIELSFPQPEADLASILIIMITIGHTLTAIMWYFLYLFKLKFFTSPQIKKEYTKASEDVQETELFLDSDADVSSS